MRIFSWTSLSMRIEHDLSKIILRLNDQVFYLKYFYLLDTIIADESYELLCNVRNGWVVYGSVNYLQSHIENLFYSLRLSA